MAKKTIQQNTICSNENLLKGKLFKNVCLKNHMIDEARIEMLVSLMALTKELEAGKAANLKRYNMSEGRFFVLMALWQADRPLKATEIAEGLGVSRATMTGLLDSLVEDELVNKTDSEVDRRIHSLVISKKGAALMKVIMPDHFQRVKNFTEILTKEESRTLATIVCKLLKGIKSFTEE